jgi:hypothetical protein
MPSTRCLVPKPVQSLGGQAVLYPGSHVSAEEELTVLDRLPLEMYVLDH